MTPTNKYLVGTGFRNSLGPRGEALAWYYPIWLQNTVRHADPQAIYVISGGNGPVPKDQYGMNLPSCTDIPIVWIDVLGDLGHCGMLISGAKKYHFGGWTIDLLILAMLAYENECDFIYKEQDVLAFGHYTERMYSEIGNKGCIFGSSKLMGAANSLILIRHWFIPEFVRLYLGTGPEGDPANIGEAKIAKLEQEHTDKFCRYSFGVDRDRPFDKTAPIWYGQKFTRDDLIELRDAGLIHFEGDPPESKTFSNC